MRAPCALRMNVSFLIGQLLGGQVQASGAHATETGKEVIRRGNVFGDLRFEFFGARKLPFFAEALPETDFDVARREPLKVGRTPTLVTLRWLLVSPSRTVRVM